jgi:hypothetical protein
MATYREIHGKAIKSVSTDPSATTDEGQIWYNTASSTFKSIVQSSAWVSSTPTSNTYDQNGGCGTQTAALTGAGSDKTSMEEYNGLGWTTGGAVPDPQELMSQLAGTQTAAIMKSGLHAPSAPPRYNTEAYTYNGTSWSSIPAAPGNRVRGAAVGTQTAFLCAGGASGPPTFTNRLSTSIEYDGSWTAGGALSTARAYLAGLGTQTAAIMAGGAVPPSYSGTNVTEQYDGTSFSSLPTLNTARHGLSSAGTTTSNIVFGGGAGPPFENKTESYDGTAWTVQPTMGTGRTYLGGAGADSTAAVAMCGNTGSASSLVEEYNTSVNTFTAAAWASAPSTNTALGTTAGCGSVTAGLVFSGANALTNSEKYDGTSWTATPALNVGRYAAGEATNAPQTAALCFAGVADPGTNNKDATEEWNGSSWSAQTALPVAMRQVAGFGIQTAAVSIGGYSTTYIAESYEYNGSSWTAGGDMNTSRERAAGCGLETAGLAMGGNTPSPYIANVEEYDGSSWTNATALPTANKLGSAAGIQTDAIFFAGNVPPNNVVGTTLGYDGTNWSTRPSMGTGRQAGAGAGTSTAALMMAGANVSGTALTTVEEFTGETSAVNVKTLTQS